MTKDNPQLDELRKKTGVLLSRLFTSLSILEMSIDTAPDLESLRHSPSRAIARQSLDQFRRWIISGALDDAEREQLAEGLLAATREDAEMR